MENIPSEMHRMFFEHMTHTQRKGVSRVSRLFAFLTMSFVKQPKRFRNAKSLKWRNGESNNNAIKDFVVDSNRIILFIED